MDPDRMRASVRLSDDPFVVARRFAAPCANPWRVEAALVELLQNAFEHGNLGFDGADKCALQLAGRWQQALSQRASRPALAGLGVTVTRTVHADRWTFSIEDQGGGFDPQAVLVDGAGSDHPSGRGLKLVEWLVGAPLRFECGGRRVLMDVPFDAVDDVGGG